MEFFNSYTFTDPLFYDTIGRFPINTEYVDHLKELLPEAWQVRRHGVWVGANCSDRTPLQGFKIHVSSTPADAHRLLDLVVPVLVEREINFKIAGGPRLLSFLNSKNYERGYSGKFMTIYPPDEATFKQLIEQLYERTRHEEVAGPYILSDRRYKDSKVIFYRYGGMLRKSELQADGTTRSLIAAPDGTLVPDQRLPYFQLPAWVEDPFGGTAGVEYEGDAVLNNRYEIESVLSFSNAGGVYLGRDTQTGDEVIIKEARPRTHNWVVETGFLDSVGLLENEYRVLERLRHLDFVPQPIDFFQEWEHTYLVEEKVPGVPVARFQVKPSIIYGPHAHKPGRAAILLSYFKPIAEGLLRMMRGLHEHGVIFGDLSPNNVLVERDTLRTRLIDFEGSVCLDAEAGLMSFATAWGTTGFMRSERMRRETETLTVEDDYFAAGMLLFSLVMPVQRLSALKPDTANVFLDRCIRLGLPPMVKTIINTLLAGDADGAEALLASWDEPSPYDPALAEDPEPATP